MLAYQRLAMMAVVPASPTIYFRPVQDKRHLNQWLNGFMAMLLLFATSGASLTRMTCLAGGHSSVSLGLAADCCPEEEHADGPVIKALCCDITEARLDQPALLLEKQLALVALLHAVTVQPTPSPALLPASQPDWLDTRPPPISAHKRLSLLRTRLV